jgi:hypothetical protein
MSDPKLTVYFIVEPPEYQILACYLAASLRQQFGQTVALVGYCPAQKMDLIAPDVLAALGKMDCPVRPMQVEGLFDPPYPHGNKLVATLQPRSTDYSCFMDSDVLCIRPNDVENLIRPGHVCLTPAASMNWAKQTVWDVIYAAAGMEIPDERFMLMKQKKGKPRIPYFSSGLFVFPEQHRNDEGKTFAQVWYEMARLLDAHPDIPHKRPYLDQISLPLAIQKSGLNWHKLPPEQHFILGGRARGEPLPNKGRDIFTVHYRQWPILNEVGLRWKARNMLKTHAGVKSVGSGPVEEAADGQQTADAPE